MEGSCRVPTLRGAPLRESGVENGEKLTPEAALVRLWLELSE